LVWKTAQKSFSRLHLLTVLPAIYFVVFAVNPKGGDYSSMCLQDLGTIYLTQTFRHTVYILWGQQSTPLLQINAMGLHTFVYTVTSKGFASFFWNLCTLSCAISQQRLYNFITFYSIVHLTHRIFAYFFQSLLCNSTTLFEHFSRFICSATNVA